MRRFFAICLISALALVSCAGGGSKSAPENIDFPMVRVPGMVGDGADGLEYLHSHYWDEFLSLDGPCDTAGILGVRKGEVAKALSNYISLSESVPLEFAQDNIRKFFLALEAKQEEDTASRFFRLMTEMVSLYLYDPNSPLRNEDLYLPFVRCAAVSEYTREDMRPAYQYEAEACALNQQGHYVPDFKIRDINGRTFTLYSVKAEYTMLFFSNPDCGDCKNIISQVMGREYVEREIEAGRLAVVNVYIDEDVRAWRKYEKNYPRSWRNGYDPKFVIRKDELYNVRAIPSLYLLDSGKRVIMKDAPTEKVMRYLDNIFAR